jgi:hypothetical protein
VARELTSNGGGILTQSCLGWTMSVQDEHGTEFFSAPVRRRFATVVMRKPHLDPWHGIEVGITRAK